MKAFKKVLVELSSNTSSEPDNVEDIEETIAENASSDEVSTASPEARIRVESPDGTSETSSATKLPIQMPVLWVTDYELALMGAVEAVFPSANLILCRWHISKNIAANKKEGIPALQWKLFNSFLSCLFNAQTVEIFNTLWRNLEEN